MRMLKTRKQKTEQTQSENQHKSVAQLTGKGKQNRVFVIELLEKSNKGIFDEKKKKAGQKIQQNHRRGYFDSAQTVGRKKYQ